MKFHQIAVAAAAAALASSAFAAPAYLSGASASAPDAVAALNSLCGTAGGTFTVFKAATTAYKLENIVTMQCSVPFSAASGVDTVYLNTNGGSLNSVIWPLQNVAVTYADPTSASCALVTSGAADTLSPYTVKQGCGVTTHQSEGGFSDTEVSLASNYLSSIGVDISNVTTKSASLLQTFGVAISDDLYVLLYKAQYGNLISNSIGCPDAAVATNAQIVGAYNNQLCQPSVSRAEMASIMNGTAFAKANGTLIFNNVTTGAKLTYCRRPVTSGTQQTAQNYFLTNPASASGLTVAGGDTAMANSASKIEQFVSGVKYNVLAGSGTGDTVNCLGGRNQDTTPGTNGSISAGPVYRIGVVSAEKVAPVSYASPTTSATGGWKFARLSEVALTEGTTSAKNVATAQAGRYDFVVESRYNTETSVTPASTAQVLSDIAANITGNTYPGMYKIKAASGATPGSFNHANNDSKAPVVR